MTETKTAGEPIRIKKYANRRLYNTQTSAYVTLDDLANMVKAGDDFVVNDAKTGEDITHSVLTQIIFEQESKGSSLLPISFLRQLIRFYGDSMQSLVPSFLEISVQQFAQEQSQLREQMARALGAPYEIVDEQVRRNMEMFREAMGMFAPFQQGGQRPRGSEAGAQAEPQSNNDGNNDEIGALKDQLAAIQAQLDKMNRERN